MKSQPVFIITGKQGEGKTTALLQLVDHLKKAGIAVAGFVAQGEWEKGLRTQFFLNDINSDTKKLLCKSVPGKGFEQIGRFYFNPETIRCGEKLIENAKPGDLIVIDEIGMFELKGKVWGTILKKKLMEGVNPLIISARSQFLDTITEHFKLDRSLVFDCKEDTILLSEKICSILKIDQNAVN